MKKFREYISEEVVPTALVTNGSIDLDQEEVRASINMALAKVTADGSITPYIALNRISKALAQFHIIVPKRVYLEGAKGVEVHELRQFGHKMGMTDTGEFVHDVPGKYFLFIQYGMNTPMVHGGQKAWPTMGGTFRVMAKVVDPDELSKLISMAELSLAEDCIDAEHQQRKAKLLAPREKMKDLDVDGSPSTDDGVAISMRRKDKKLSAGKLDEGMKIVSKGYGNVHVVKSGKTVKKFADPRDARMFVSQQGKKKTVERPVKEEQIDELDRGMFGILGRYIRKTTDDPKHKEGRNLALKKRWGDKEYGLPEPKVKAVERPVKEETLDEISKEKLAGYIPKAAHSAALMAAKRAAAGVDAPGYEKSLQKQMKRHRGIQTAAEKLATEESLDEKLTKSMSAGDIISDFVHSDDPKFKGKSKKERQKMALGAYYSMHPGESKKKVDEGYNSKVVTKKPSGVYTSNMDTAHANIYGGKPQKIKWRIRPSETDKEKKLKKPTVKKVDEGRLDELSQKTLKSYERKAEKSMDAAINRTLNYKERDTDAKTVNKRLFGLKLADKKIKEETLEELHGKGKLGDITKASYKKMQSHPLGHGHPENPHTHDVHRGNELARMQNDDEWYAKHGGRGFKRGIKGFAQSQLHRAAKKEFLAKHGANEELKFDPSTEIPKNT